MKLNLVVHLKQLDEDSLAKQVFDEQIRHNWPGLAKEAKDICQKWKMDNVTREEEEVKSKKMWKRIIQMKAKEEEGRELREKMKKYQKLQDVIEEDYGKKSYLDEMSSKDAKLWFRVRSKMIKCKMNFSSDKKNRETLWLCDCGCIDTQSHLMWCRQLDHLREGSVLDSDQDILDFLKKAFQFREEKNMDSL